jgi:hypothetical protein
VRVLRLNGSTPTEVASFYAYNPAFTGGVYVAAGDVTGDGVAKIITGAGPGGGPHVRVIGLGSGGALTELASFYAYDAAFIGGVHVAAGDVSGDGVAKLITGAGPFGGPHVRVLDLSGGGITELASFYAYDPAFIGGVFVASAQPMDVDGAGVPRSDRRMVPSRTHKGPAPWPAPRVQPREAAYRLPLVPFGIDAPPGRHRIRACCRGP